MTRAALSTFTPERPVSTLRGVVRQTVRRAQEGHLSVSRQVLEMAVLKLFYGLGPGHYHTARYWRKTLPWAFKTGFWPYRKFRRVVSAINFPPYHKLSQHKVCEKAILQLVGIPTPRFIGNLHHQRGRSLSGDCLTSPGELQDLLAKNPDSSKICFKLVEGYGGQGFQAVEAVREAELKLRLADSGEVMSVPEFLSDVLAIEQGGDFIIEEYIKQHQELSKMNPSSVNTVRIWACCIEGETAVMGAFLRVGGRGSLVDNTSRGAHIFTLDLDSGVVGDGMVKNIYNDTYQCHRDSGVRISGVTLPFWHESLRLAQQAVMAFPHIGFAGVDVAITEKGPVVVELNVEPDPTSAIIFDRSHRDLLEVFTSALSV
ncbi:MAG: sugar-transfer associated ATP-grasp domain-containing protein [Pseudohongiellaceae bacterium]